MSTFQRLSAWVRHATLTVFIFLLTLIVPEKGKRMMFMTSLYVKMKGITPSTPQVLSPLVTDLHVASDARQLMFPANLKTVDWDNETLDKIQSVASSSDTDTDNALKSLCLAIVNSTPKLLQYGRKDDMVADMIRVVNITQRTSEA